MGPNTKKGPDGRFGDPILKKGPDGRFDFCLRRIYLIIVPACVSLIDKKFINVVLEQQSLLALLVELLLESLLPIR